MCTVIFWEGTDIVGQFKFDNRATAETFRDEQWSKLKLERKSITIHNW